LIAVQYGLLGFLKAFCKVTVHALPVMREDGATGFDTRAESIWSGLRERSDPVKHLSHLLAAYVFGGDPSPTERREALRRALPELPLAAKGVVSALELVQALGAAAEIMWALVEPLLIGLRGTGECPASLWG
jgi:hypothetical protein